MNTLIYIIIVIILVVISNLGTNRVLFKDLCKKLKERRNLKGRYLCCQRFDDAFKLIDYVNKHDLDVVNISSYTDEEDMITYHMLWHWFYPDVER